jgi:hypothetical protein
MPAYAASLLFYLKLVSSVELDLEDADCGKTSGRSASFPPIQGSLPGVNTFFEDTQFVCGNPYV